MKFNGENVLITGASKGIGAQIAKTLASYGLKVWINYRSKPELAQKVKEEIESSGGKAAVIKFDASIEEEFIAGLKVITQSDEKLAYLVNNAGITNDKLALRMSVEDFENVIDANLKSCFIGCREALKIMSKQRFGSVVNIASIIGERGNMGQTNYAASKAGIIGFTKSLAKEVASRNILVNAIAPGFIKTDMTNVLKDEIKEEIEKNIPLKRLGTTADVANLVETRKTTDIVDISNESSKDGLRIVIELKKNADAEKLVNLLYKKTKLEDTFGVNMLAIANGKPERLSLKDIIRYHIDFQMENECSAYASAYVMRHLGRQVAGSELYNDIHRVFGFVSVNSVVSLFQSYGYTAKAYHGDNSTLKQRLISGVPVIAFIRTPDDTHYVVVVGYDENFIYLVDSISDNANANGGWYNRKLSTEEFDAIWKTNMYPVENIYIVISGL